MVAFVSEHVAPGKRAKFVVDGIEHKFTEGAVQVAVALALLADPENDGWAEVFPDGEHGKRFAIKECLEHHGFTFESSLGTTSYGGIYRCGSQRLIVNPKSAHGRGDVVSSLAGRIIRVECKGSTTNSAHSGVKSRIRSGLAELIGQAMAMEDNGDRHVIALPATAYAEMLAVRLAPRCRKAGIEIALVEADGRLIWV